MKKELEKTLIEKYPKIFRDMYGDETQTCLTWGCECGDGWFGLIDELCDRIVQLDPPDDFYVLQVKEKFGGLRFYTIGATLDIDDLIDEAEHRSYKICESCGSMVDVVLTSGWMTTICKKCLGKENSNA